MMPKTTSVVHDGDNLILLTAFPLLVSVPEWLTEALGGGKKHSLGIKRAITIVIASFSLLYIFVWDVAVLWALFIMQRHAR